MNAATQLVRHGLSAASPLSDGVPYRINYPESAAPEKYSSSSSHISFITAELIFPTKEDMSSETPATVIGSITETLGLQQLRVVTLVLGETGRAPVYPLHPQLVLRLTHVQLEWALPWLGNGSATWPNTEKREEVPEQTPILKMNSC